MATKRGKVEYARMWPREIFDVRDGKQSLAARLDFLKEKGVYILYRDEHPYYIGKADKLFSRLHLHAVNPKTRYYNFWTHFSAFALPDKKGRDKLEAMLIVALPTVNSAKPRLVKDTPPEVAKLLKKIRERKVEGLTLS
ncbi:MAG: GIY-YIG nuclease family protein [Acidobacteriales bacterium]|nr:GIY-YIG nuclease family protein [Candidatus Koribacter versatilis]MBI3645849.1 GIY-YIG nuclease family protein [Terriglobales bacterium]